MSLFEVKLDLFQRPSFGFGQQEGDVSQGQSAETGENPEASGNADDGWERDEHLGDDEG